MLKNSTKLKLIGFLIVFAVLILPQLLQAQTNGNAGVEEKVREYFADVPVMISIAKCESGFQQYRADGSTFYDRSGTYVGVFQIYEKVHATAAANAGLDIKTLEGNLAYARKLYNASGTNPWKGCLGGAAVTPAPAVSVPGGSLSANLNFGMTNTQVKSLQKKLNNNGFVISSSGPGSPGNETMFFGSLTKEAVKKFQCSKGIACSGTESTTGYGRVGPMTRAALNQLP